MKENLILKKGFYNQSLVSNLLAYASIEKVFVLTAKPFR